MTSIERADIPELRGDVSYPGVVIVPFANLGGVFEKPTRDSCRFENVVHAQEVVYDLLFRTRAETLLEIARDPQHLDAAIGSLSVAPHLESKTVHCVVPVGRLFPIARDRSTAPSARPAIQLLLGGLARVESFLNPPGVLGVCATLSVGLTLGLQGNEPELALWRRRRLAAPVVPWAGRLAVPSIWSFRNH